jgi:hypothetical protein
MKITLKSHFEGLKKAMMSHAWMPSTSDTDGMRDTEIIGPFVRFGYCDVTTDTWNGSILILTSSRITTVPSIILRSRTVGGESSTVALACTKLDTIDGMFAWRCDLAIIQDIASDTIVKYAVTLDRLNSIASLDHAMATLKTYEFHVAQARQPCHWMFYSCNGRHEMTDDVAMDKAMIGPWTDVLKTHHANPLHICVGTGDQIYADDVFKVIDEVADWLSRLQRHHRVLNEPVPPQVLAKLDKFYSSRYVSNFMRVRTVLNDNFNHVQPAVSDAFASIPSVMLWDDHDIFDGYGSYDTNVQQAPMVRAIFQAARRCYLLFQHHTTQSGQAIEQAEAICVDNSASFLKPLDMYTILLGLDARGDRTKDACLSGSMWKAIQERVDRDVLPTFQHMVVIAPVPVVWPSMFVAEAALVAMGAINKRLDLAKLVGRTHAFKVLFIHCLHLYSSRL